MIEAAIVDASVAVKWVVEEAGSDRALLKRANEMLLAAGCKREGGALKLPSGAPFSIACRHS